MKKAAESNQKLMENNALLQDVIKIINEFKSIESGKNVFNMQIEHSKNKYCFLGGSMMLLLLGIDLKGKNGRTDDYSPDIDIICPYNMNDICIPEEARFVDIDTNDHDNIFFDYSIKKKDANGYDCPCKTYRVNLLRNTVHQETNRFLRNNESDSVEIGSLNALVETKMKYVLDACAEWDGHGNTLHAKNLVHYIKYLKERFNGRMFNDDGKSGNMRGISILKQFKDVVLILNEAESDNTATENLEGMENCKLLHRCNDLRSLTILQMRIFRLINENVTK